MISPFTCGRSRHFFTKKPSPLPKNVPTHHLYVSTTDPVCVIVAWDSYSRPTTTEMQTLKSFLLDTIFSFMARHGRLRTCIVIYPRFLVFKPVGSVVSKLFTISPFSPSSDRLIHHPPFHWIPESALVCASYSLFFGYYGVVPYRYLLKYHDSHGGMLEGRMRINSGSSISWEIQGTYYSIRTPVIT